MLAFGYIFIATAVLALLVIFVTAVIWFTRRLSFDREVVLRISNVGFFLNMLFTGLILIMTIYICLNLSPSDYIDALLTASPLLISAIFLVASISIIRATRDNR